jgi:hypothetical protein
VYFDDRQKMTVFVGILAVRRWPAAKPEWEPPTTQAPAEPESAACEI